MLNLSRVRFGSSTIEEEEEEVVAEEEEDEEYQERGSNNNSFAVGGSRPNRGPYRSKSGFYANN